MFRCERHTKTQIKLVDIKATNVWWKIYWVSNIRLDITEEKISEPEDTNRLHKMKIYNEKKGLESIIKISSREGNSSNLIDM